jgi:hypothetical protein
MMLTFSNKKRGGLPDPFGTGLHHTKTGYLHSKKGGSRTFS